MQDNHTPNVGQEEDAIRSILEKAQDRTAMGHMRERMTDEGATEFLFQEDAYRGLVFEEGDQAPPAAAPKKGKPSKAPTPMQPTEEFSVPKTAPAASSSSQASFEQPLRTYHTYVPVFTEASENYRMTGRTTRDVPEEPTRPTQLRRETVKGPVVEVVASTDIRHDAQTADAATDELPEELHDELHVSEQTVHVRVEPTISPEPQPVYTQVPAPPQKPLTLDEEKDEIHRLLYGDRVTTEEVMPEDVTQVNEMSEPVQETEPDEPIPQPSREPSLPRADASYLVPDPEGDELPVHTPAYRTPNAAKASTAAPAPKRRRREKEYQMYSDSTKIKNRFLDSLLSFRVRMAVAALLTLLLLTLVLLPAVRLDIRALLGLDEFKALPALIDLQLCLCLIAVTLPEIVKFCEALFAKQLLLPVLPLASSVFLLAYDIYMCFADITTYPLYGSLYGLGLLAMIVAAYFMQDAMFSAFNLISVKGVKQAVERVKTRELEQENIALDGVIDEYSSYIARMFKTPFISGFFHRHRPPVRRKASLLLTLCIVGGCSLVVGVVAFFLRSGWFDAFSAAAMTCMAAMPTAWILCRPYAYARAERCCFLEDSAIIGESTLFDYADVDVVTYDDTEVFGLGDVALKRVLIYGDKSRLSGALRQMASLFSAVGGPLNMLFSDTLDRRPLPAVRVHMSTDGIRGETEGCTVHAGTAEYMLRHGFSIPSESGRPEGSATTRVLYLAEGGVVYAKFMFRYAFSEAFSQLIPIFKEKHIVPLIYTRDPNVTRELLCALSTGEDRIRELHVTTPAVEDEVRPASAAGMVTLGDKNNAVQLILLAKEYVTYHKRMDKLFLAQALCGLVLGAVCTFMPLPFMPVPALVLWQLLWCAATFFAGAHAFSLRRKRRELIENEKELTHA